jgi:peptidoglycan/LPS O-acetylase OafA/YrhL
MEHPSAQPPVSRGEGSAEQSSSPPQGYTERPLARRNLGLDIIRAAAIILVLAAHSLTYFFRWYYLDLRELFYILAFLGVELFFVLSGFLIGKILLEEVLTGGSWNLLGRFYVRRWFRTLPPYYLMVAILIVAGRPFTWKSLVFLQNFNRSDLAFFPVSWSLSIEEWFYLLVPFLLLLATRLAGKHGRVRTAFFAASGAIIAGALALRILHVLRKNPTWDFGVREHPFVRQDSLMVGVLLAGLSVLAPRLWQFLASRRRLLFPLAAMGIFYTAVYQLFVLYRTRTVDSSLYARTIFFLIVSLLIGALLVSLETSRSVNRATASRWARAIRLLSVTSYAAYLIHLPLFDLFAPLEARYQEPLVSLVLVVVVLALTLSLSTAMYLYFERPSLRLRDRLTGNVRE